MKKLETMKAVYSYFFPEVRKLVHFESQIPEELFLNSTSADEAQKIISKMYKKPFKVPATLEGKVDLDRIHEPIIEKVIESYSEIIPSLSRFKNRYPMAGSSQGIFHLLAEIKNKGKDFAYVLKGEYEGYAEYGKTLGINVKEIGPETDFRKLDSGIWFISNPSARDGNIIENEQIEEICNSGHKVILDLAYAGSTKPYKFDVSNENIPAVVMSFSKPYGVFRFRIGGFTFSKEPVDSLYANKWFKDVPRLMTALKIVEEVPPGSLYKKYRPVQERIVANLNDEFGLGMRTSDAVLLGHLTKEDAGMLDEEKRKMIESFRRGDGYRFCLTPYFEKLEMEK
ncbi:aminotransferase class I/II-fold pyridoxal phosphate-dependent enzyme [Candidatus Woesearchaeota archaeon]|nr:aminotransferase class I/II-fold pyridoxal phosphate-dependent enzyme [Candidatus Woesearchaeota archaeon]